MSKKESGTDEVVGGEVSTTRSAQDPVVSAIKAKLKQIVKQGGRAPGTWMLNDEAEDVLSEFQQAFGYDEQRHFQIRVAEGERVTVCVPYCNGEKTKLICLDIEDVDLERKRAIVFSGKVPDAAGHPVLRFQISVDLKSIAGMKPPC